MMDSISVLFKRKDKDAIYIARIFTIFADSTFIIFYMSEKDQIYMAFDR